MYPKGTLYNCIVYRKTKSVEESYPHDLHQVDAIKDGTVEKLIRSATIYSFIANDSKLIPSQELRFVIVTPDRLSVLYGTPSQYDLKWDTLTFTEAASEEEIQNRLSLLEKETEEQLASE